MGFVKKGASRYDGFVHGFETQQAGPVNMIKILAHGNRNISDYCDSVANGRLKPCHLIMPVEFDMCGD